MIHPPSRFRFLSGAALAGMTLAALVGCQASGGELTREEFVEQGNAICAAGNAEIEAAVPKGESAAPPSGPEGEALFKTIVESSNRSIDAVAALKPPADLQPEMTSIIADARVIMADMEAQGMEALFSSEDDPFAEVNVRLRAVGLTVCGEDMAE